MTTGVKYLKYRGKKLPLKLGIYTLMLVQEEYGITLDNMEPGVGLPPSQYQPLLFYGLKQGHQLEKKEFKYTMDDMHDVLNDCFFEFMEMLPDFLPKEDDMLEKTEEGVGKKEKLTESKKKPTAEKVLTSPKSGGKPSPFSG